MSKPYRRGSVVYHGGRKQYLLTKVPWQVRKPRWWAKQKLAGESRFYGDGGTIHHTGQLDVGVDKNGVVVAVWFRCQMLPFKQYDADKSGAGQGNPLIGLTGVEVRDQ